MTKYKKASLLLSLVLLCALSITLLKMPGDATNAFAAASFQDGDDALASVRRSDRASRGADGRLAQLSVAEHLRRAKIYMTNRVFAEAREHWQAILEDYPDDPNVSAALFGIARSLMQERRYEQAVPPFERVVREFGQTKDGREELYMLATTLLRMGHAEEAAARYRDYTEKYPQGERVEGAYLNVVDSLREAGHSKEAINWINLTREKFRGTSTDTNALFARLRLDVSSGDWKHAVQTADELRSAVFKKDVATNADEVAYLRAFSLEKAGRTEDAINAYLAIPDRINSYYGGLATARLLALNSAAKRPAVIARAENIKAEINGNALLYPAPYRDSILRATARRKVDPRFVLAIMRQESGFRPHEKSSAAARGLLQLTAETVAKYAPRAGLKQVNDEDLYRPDISILVGSEYLSELAEMFPNLPEAVAASYNGGEDNVARWLTRAGHQDPGVFASEVGFSETKDYVFKVLSNYRAYRQLYTADLRQK